jgi:hypothetical protein
MSAMVSVMLMASFSASLPGRLLDARDLAPMGHVPEADAADRELADERPRPPAQEATVAVTRLVLRRPLRLIDLGNAGQFQASSFCG